MKVITAVENYEKQEGDIFCFLAGGITNCWEWQDAVIEALEKNYIARNAKNLIILNPRRKNFPINDPNASDEQIAWEFNNLEQMDIFSMYFCGNTQSDQPICFYELGRNLNRFATSGNDSIVITVESDFKRVKDVEIQTNLAIKNSNNISIEQINSEEDRKRSAINHANRIAEIYLLLLLKS